MSSVILKGFGDGHSQSPAKEMAQEKLSEAKKRSHLLTCFEKKQLTSFPNERRTAREKYLYFPMQEINRTFCTCFMPETYGTTYYQDYFINVNLIVNCCMTTHCILFITSFSCKDYFRVKVSLVDTILLHNVSGRTLSASC